MLIHRWAPVALQLAGFVALSLSACGLLAQNLVVQWEFDEAAGGTVNADDTGAAPATSGVLGATATRTTDTPGAGPGFALELSAAGTSSIVDGGNPLEVDTLSQFTFSSWIKVTGTTHYNEGGSVNVRLLSKQSGGAFDGFTWNLTAPATPPGNQNNFRTGLFVGGANGFNFSFSTADIVGRGGDWFFLAVTYDGTTASNNASFYIGDETTPVALLGSVVSIPAGQVNSTNTGNGGAADARFGIGFTDAAPTADTSLTGFQDDVRVYDGVLDLAALDAVRLANLPPDTGLDGDFNFDGKVDAADYIVWRLGLGTTHTQDDFNTWRANFGAMTGSGSAGDSSSQNSVPEPSAMHLAIFGALVGRACLTQRRRERRVSVPWF